MSVVDQLRSRLETVRTNVQTRIKTIRGTYPLLREFGPRFGSSIEFPKLKEVREKGVMTVLSETFPRIKEIRAGGLLKTPILGSSPSPAPKSSTIERKELRVRGARVVL